MVPFQSLTGVSGVGPGAFLDTGDLVQSVSMQVPGGNNVQLQGSLDNSLWETLVAANVGVDTLVTATTLVRYLRAYNVSGGAISVWIAGQ